MLRREKIVMAPGIEDVLREHGLGSVGGVYGSDAGERAAGSETTLVRRVQLGAPGPVVFIKRYWFSAFSQLWSGALRGTLFGCSKVRREFENLALLRARGLDAPEPLAYGEERKAGWLLRSYLISRGIPEPEPLHVFIRERFSGPNDAHTREQRRELVQNLARYTRRMHQEQFLHHDYFWRNILLSGGRLDRFYLIDAHKGRRWLPWEEHRARARDLAALDSPAPRFFRRTERLRFFLIYRGHRKLDASDKTLLRRVLKIAAPMRERQIHRALGIRLKQ